MLEPEPAPESSGLLAAEEELIELELLPDDEELELLSEEELPEDEL